MYNGINKEFFGVISDEQAGFQPGRIYVNQMNET